MNWTWPLLNRAKQLRDAGLSYQAVATVLALDNNASVSKSAVRSALHKHFDIPRDYRRGTNGNLNTAKQLAGRRRP